ncbi:uncharacterized protein LOC144376989 isoform X1 [Ictidomys tridecemlineatus]
MCLRPRAPVPCSWWLSASVPPLQRGQELQFSQSCRLCPASPGPGGCGPAGGPLPHRWAPGGIRPVQSAGETNSWRSSRTLRTWQGKVSPSREQGSWNQDPQPQKEWPRPSCHLGETWTPFLTASSCSRQSSTRFQVDFQCGCSLHPQLDIAIHFNPRFHTTKPHVICNTLHSGRWQREARWPGVALQRGASFLILFLFGNEEVKVSVNGWHFLHYRYRLPLSRVDTLGIFGDILVKAVGFLNISPFVEGSREYPTGYVSLWGQGWPCGWTRLMGSASSSPCTTCSHTEAQLAPSCYGCHG